MPSIRQEGKDRIIFATKEDHATPSKIVLPEPEPSPGLLLPNGEINWNCPCLGGMATGPCGLEFREAFSCFHYSNADPKGSDCYEAFKTMQSCMSQYPALYGSKSSDIEDMSDEGMAIENNEAEDSSANDTNKSSQISTAENQARHSDSSKTETVLDRSKEK